MKGGNQRLAHGTSERTPLKLCTERTVSKLGRSDK
jgi:hypothetical protein